MTHESTESSTGRPQVDAFDPTAFPLVTKGNLFEDFTVGQEFDHHWGRTIGWSEAATFATSTGTWLPLYTNVEYAGAHGHRDILVHPMLVLCAAVGLSVEDLSEAGGPFLGVDDCAFEADVYPGDTITCRSVVLAVRPSSNRPTNGVVTWRTTVVNQHGDTVLTFVRSNLIARRER